MGVALMRNARRHDDDDDDDDDHDDDDNALFIGWITKGSQKDLLNARLQSNETISGVIDSSELFVWRVGGGNCFRGDVTLTLPASSY